MQHSSLFEPLFSQQAHNMEKCQAAFISQGPPSLFSICPPSPSSPPHVITRENTPSSFALGISCGLPADTPNCRKARSEQDLTSDLTLGYLPPSLPHPAFSATSSSDPCSLSAPASACSNNDADDRLRDDGSVASKLLSSITKSISSPSLQLQSCKEPARETPYQKTLKLKQMKLQHCAEALGMESSDNSSLFNSSHYIHQEKEIGMTGNANGFSPSSFTQLPNSHQESSLKSVRSVPNLSSALPATANASRYTRSKSFPPPLSHTLPTSSSCDSLSLSLCAYREDGRFILKETMVPSKHYFQANRSNGRLTLHVVTREEEAEEEAEEEEHFTRLDDHEELSYREVEKESLSEVEEEVYVKRGIGSHIDMSLQSLSCTAQDDHKNVISNVITLSLQTSSQSKVTLHKAQVLSYPLAPSSLQQSAFIPSSKRNHGFLSSNHDMSAFPQSKQNFIWESNLIPCAAAMGSSQHLQRKRSGSCGAGNNGGGKATVPAFVIEEKAKKLVKAVSAVATSLVFEASYDASGDDWCLVGEKEPLLSVEESVEGSIIIGGYANGVDIATTNGKIIGDDGLISHVAKFGYTSSYINEEEKARNSTCEGGKEVHATTSPSTLDLQFYSCNATLQCEEWLQSLHCKELYDRRHHLAHGLIKLHCIPTRS